MQLLLLILAFNYIFCYNINIRSLPMSRLRSRQPYSSRERANRSAGPKEMSEDIYIPRQQFHRAEKGATDRVMHIHRSLARQGEIGTTAMLAIVGSMPRDISVHRRATVTLGVSMLDATNLTRHKKFTSRDPNYDPEALRRTIKRNVPSFRKPLGEISVKDVIQIGSKRAPALALEVASPQLDEEMDAINAIVALQRGDSSVEIDVKPHISIATFPGLREIPQNILDAVHEAAPNHIDLDPGEFYGRDWE